MMRYRLLFMFLFFFFVAFQAYSQDNIELKEVLIEKSLKKPKLKKIKVGTYDLKYSDNYLFFNQNNVFYLTDCLPKGYIQQVALFFVETAIKPEFGGRDYKTFKIQKTEFEITLYEVGDNYSVGNKVNAEPIMLVLEETDNDRVRKIELDIAKYNFQANKFFIHLKKSTETTCEDCYYYSPVLYRTGDKYNYISDYRKDIYKRQLGDCSYCLGLQMVVKTLTQDY